MRKHVYREKETMLDCMSPFLVNLIATFNDQQHLYMLMEVAMGGDLFSLLQARENPLKEEEAKFYLACVILALEHLENRQIAFRDLKPENLLVGNNGYLKLADFGFATKIVQGKAYTMVGTPDYMSPEMVSHTGHTRTVDIWSLGVLLYEMLVGITPFYNPEDQIDTFRRIVQCDLNIPPIISSSSADLITRLMRLEPTKRLGGGKGGIKEIKQHHWFDKFDWTALNNQTMPAPHVPNIAGPRDCSYFAGQVVKDDLRLRDILDADAGYLSQGDFEDF
jgi:cGMP-dependent protein kinase